MMKTRFKPAPPAHSLPPLGTDQFIKRTYRVPGFYEDAAGIMRSLWKDGWSSSGEPGLERAFAERIMLSVTRVNQCRYCAYGHSLAALRAGISSAELSELLSGEYSRIPEEELPALLFAEHYADRSGRVDEAAMATLQQTYGEVRAAKVLLAIRMITLGNLLGNTFDALLARLRGRRVADGNPLEHLSVLILAFLSTPLLLGVGAVSRLGGAARRLLADGGRREPSRRRPTA